MAPKDEEGRSRRILRGLIIGLVSAFLGYAVVAAGLFGALPVLLLLLLIVVLPLSETLSRRLAVGGTILLGWTPVIWWFHWSAELNHGAMVTGLLSGVLGGWVTSLPRGTHARIWPRMQPIDALPLLVGVLATGLMYRWASVKTPQQALTILLPGYDNVGHFSMFEMLQRYGITSDRLGPSEDGTAWHYANYPQGFHAVAATYADLLGVEARGGEASLVMYAHALAAVVVFTMVVLSAALCALPTLRRRQWVAVPVVGMVCSAYLIGPGGTGIADGFAPFWFACALVSVAITLAVASPRPVLPLHVAAIGGAVVGVAHSWAPLCLLAFPAFVILAYPFGRHRWRANTSSWLAVSVLAVLSSAAVGKAALLLSGAVSVDHVVSAAGGFSPPDPKRLLLVVILAVGACVTAPRIWSRFQGPHFKNVGNRARMLRLVVLFSLASSSWLLTEQIMTAGKPEYYFFKYVSGIELVFVTVIAIILSVIAVPLSAVWSGRNLAFPCIASLLVVPLLVSSSPVTPDLLNARRPGTADLEVTRSRPRLADNIVMATRVVRNTSNSVVLLALPPGNSSQAAFPESWVLALSGGWTSGADLRARPLVANVQDIDEAVPVVQQLIAGDDKAVVLVPPRYLIPLRERFGSHADAMHIKSWTENDAYASSPSQ